MKIAVSGKGGVGKTTFVAFLVRVLADAGWRVLAIDADGDADLALALGLQERFPVEPLSEMKALIEERTGAAPGSSGSWFRLNPRVDDLPERFSLAVAGLRLMVLGGVKQGGGGCICPESSLLRNLVSHLLLERDDAEVLDMEAGLEHMGRGTARAVDHLVVVVEPGRRSLQTARQVRSLAADLGMPAPLVLVNKLGSESERTFIEAQLEGFEILGSLPMRQAIQQADLSGRPPFETDPASLAAVREMVAPWLGRDQ